VAEVCDLGGVEKDAFRRQTEVTDLDYRMKRQIARNRGRPRTSVSYFETCPAIAG